MVTSRLLKVPLARTLQVYRHLSAMSHPSTVKSIIFAETGDLDVIQEVTKPFPQQLPGEVLVKAQYAGVNFIDTYFRSGLYPVPALPYTMGQESGGIVVSLPKDTATLNEEQFKKRGYALGSNVAVLNKGGAFSEYISVPWQAVYPLPMPVSVLTGAASILQGFTALSFLNEAYPLRKGDTILIHTVAGGFGLIAAQIAKAKGATVIGTTSTPEKAAYAKAHGVDHVILYRTEDTVQRVLEITNGKGVDAVFDGVGKDTFDNNFKLAARKATLVSLGNASGVVPPFAPVRLMEKNLKLVRPTVANYVTLPEEGLAYSTGLYNLISNKYVKINVFKEYPFTAEGVKSAQRDLTGGKTTGKLVIKISD